MSRKQIKNHKQGHTLHRKGSVSTSNRSTRKRVLVWLLSLTTVALTSFVTADFTNLGNATSSLIENLLSSTGLPVQIDSARPSLTMSMGDTHAFANALVLSNSELSHLNSLNFSAPGYQAWLASHHAVDTGSTTAELVIEGNRNHTVRITNIQPIVSCRAPLSGTLFYSPPGGADTSTRLFIDLDHPLATPSYIMGDDSGKDFFGKYTVSLHQGEQYTFKIVASTAKHFCRFTLAMTVVDGDKTTTEMITNNGQPFQVTSTIDNHPMTYGEFSAYQALYIGGVMSPNQNRFYDGLWMREDPKTFCSCSSPESSTFAQWNDSNDAL